MHDNDAEAALRRRVWNSLQPVTAALTVLYLVFTISHSLLLPEEIKLPMVALASGTVVLLLALSLGLSRAGGGEHLAYPLATLVITLLAVNSAVHVHLSQDIAQTTNMMLIILGSGFVILKRSWYTLSIVMTLATWVISVASLTHQPLFTHFVFALFSATLASVAFRYVHVRDLLENHRLRMDTEAQRQEMETLATKDELTGLANRRKFLECLEREIALSKRLEHRIAVLYMDLDEFKPMNDNHGHDFGDAVLKASARMLSELTRETDVVCRLGGDEFAVLLTGLQERGDVDKVVAKILDRFGRSEVIMGVTVPIKVSIGSAVLPDDTDAIDELLRLADLRMYANKESMKREMRKLVPGERLRELRADAAS